MDRDESRIGDKWRFLKILNKQNPLTCEKTKIEDASSALNKITSTHSSTCSSSRQNYQIQIDHLVQLIWSRSNSVTPNLICIKRKNWFRE